MLHRDLPGIDGTSLCSARISLTASQAAQTVAPTAAPHQKMRKENSG